MDYAHFLYRLVGPFEILNENPSPRLLLYLRRGVFGLWIFKMLLDPMWRLSALPLSILKGLGFLNLLTDEQKAFVFRADTLTAIWALSIVFCLLTFIPRFFAPAATVASLLVTIVSTVDRAYGDPVHTDIALVWTSWALAFFAWADLYLYYERKSAGTGEKVEFTEDARWPFFTVAALLCSTYVLVSISRIIQGQFYYNVFFNRSMEDFVVDASIRAYYFDTGLGWHAPEYPLFALTLRIGFVFITIAELVAPLAFIWPKFRWFFIPFMISFHALSLVFMNIFFFDDMLLYLVLIDWDRPLKPWMKTVLSGRLPTFESLLGPSTPPFAEQDAEQRDSSALSS